MHRPDDRIEELIAAAADGELTAAESEELERIIQRHPWVESEIERLRVTVGQLRESDVRWVDPIVTEALRERILGEIPARGAQSVPPRRRWMPPLVGAACLAVGLAIGAGVPALTSMPPTGPAGTLGAYEPIVVAEERGVDVDAELVAHTWGTEAVLDVTGLDVGETYRVVFIGENGTEFSAGEMLGSAVAIHCRLNAAVLREDAVRLEIRDPAASVIASADLPSV